MVVAIAWRKRIGLSHAHNSRPIVDHDRTPLPAYDALKSMIQQAVFHRQRRKHAPVAGRVAGNLISTWSLLESTNQGFDPRVSKAGGPGLPRFPRLWFCPRLAFRKQGRKLVELAFQAGSVR